MFSWHGGTSISKRLSFASKKSKAIQEYDQILITDNETNIEDSHHAFSEVIRAQFETTGLLRKAEMLKFLPESYDAYLFLDSDTVVLEDISLGFEKAEKFSIAVSPAPHYSLDQFWGFDRILESQGIPCKGQLQYNTGVIFFKNSEIVKSIFNKWIALVLKYQEEFKNDQPFFTLSMEELNFNPYTLSISYNYRGFGDAISGLVRIWHSHGELPKDINNFDYSWPPRKAWPSRVEYPTQRKRHAQKITNRLKDLLKFT